MSGCSTEANPTISGDFNHWNQSSGRLHNGVLTAEVRQKVMLALQDSAPGDGCLPGSVRGNWRQGAAHCSPPTLSMLSFRIKTVKLGRQGAAILKPGQGYYSSSCDRSGVELSWYDSKLRRWQMLLKNRGIKVTFWQRTEAAPVKVQNGIRPPVLCFLDSLGATIESDRWVHAQLY